MDILLGADDAATRYLERTTTASLTETYEPVVQNSLDKVNATKYWEDVITTYNKVPLVKKVNPDLNAYVTEKALDGLFFMIQKEEDKIRQGLPNTRTTEILKKVFDYYDQNK